MDGSDAATLPQLGQRSRLRQKPPLWSHQVSRRISTHLGAICAHSVQHSAARYQLVIQGPSNHAAAPSTLTCPKGLSAICKHAAALGLRRGGPPSPPFGGLCIQRELSRPRGLSGPRLLKAHDLNGRDPQPISAAELVTHLRTICSHQKPLHASQDIAAMTDSTWRNPFAHGPPTGGGVNSLSFL